MSYTTKYRKKVIEYRKEGHTMEETSRAFKVSSGTIGAWEKLLRETGSLENPARNRPKNK